jgi:hypothetical protein
MMSNLKRNLRILQVWRRLWGDGAAAKSNAETINEREKEDSDAIKQHLTLHAESPVDASLKKMMEGLPADCTVRISILNDGYSLHVLTPCGWRVSVSDYSEYEDSDGFVSNALKMTRAVQDVLLLQTTKLDEA